MEASEKQSATSRKGRITEELQQQARKTESPVVSEFLVAARKGFTQHVIQSLRAEGGSGKAAVIDKHGRNCLHLACLYGHFDTALSVLQTKLVDINCTNKRGLTALHDACTEGHTHIALLLLAMGADVLAMTKDGWTCLMCACSNGHTQLVQLLLAAGCDISVFTKLGLTALHVAAWKGHTAVVEVLIHSGANLLAQAHNGKTALHLAQEENQHECSTILKAAASKQSEQPMYRISALEGQLRMCQEKLVQAHRQQDDLMKSERSRVKAEFGGQLEEASQTIAILKKKVSELERILDKPLSKSPPDIRVDTPTPPTQGSPVSARRRKHKRKSIDTRSPEHSDDSFSLNPEGKHRSASIADISFVGKSAEDSSAEGDGRRSGVATQISLKLSPEIKRSPETIVSQRRMSNVERSSITTLVEESLRNPASIASIRKQLKSEGLTPKIQRKFPMKSSTPTSLPSMNGAVKETSPLTKEANKA